MTSSASMVDDEPMAGRYAGRHAMLDIPKIPVSDEWDMAWLGYELHERALNRAQRTIVNRKSTVNLLARWLTVKGITDPAAVTPALLKQYMVLSYAERADSGPQTLYQDLRSFWTWWAAEEGQADPFATVPRPKGSSKTVKVLNPDEIGKILDACKTGSKADTARNQAIIWLLLESGLRRFELCALDTDSIDVKARTVTVLKGKNGKARVSVFGDDAATALWRWLKLRGTVAAAAHTDALFVTKFGRLTVSGVGQLVSLIGDRAGVPLHPHQLRHTWAHFNLASGIAEGDLMQLAGWQTRSMLDRYGGALKTERALAAGRANPVGRAIRAR